MKFSQSLALGQTVSVELVSWTTAALQLSDIRHRVFIAEQGVPEALEWDGLDETAQHVLARIGAQPVAVGRLLPSGQIGRMAVLPAWRRQGIGSLVLARLLEIARAQGFDTVFLYAQLSAQAFYARHGFACEGEVFEDAGIAHITMRRPLDADEPSAP